MLLSILAATLMGAGGQLGARSEAAYPPKVEKTLYAKNDLRGKAGPKLSAATWLSGSPPNTKGKIVLVDFWATWCPPCRETIPELNTISKQSGADVVVVGISDEPVAKLREFMKGIPIAYAVGSDPAKTMNKAVGVEGIPHVLLMTPDGVVRWQGFPLDEKDPLTPAKVQGIVDAWKAGKR